MPIIHLIKYHNHVYSKSITYRKIFQYIYLIIIKKNVQGGSFCKRILFPFSNGNFRYLFIYWVKTEIKTESPRELYIYFFRFRAKRAENFGDFGRNFLKENRFSLRKFRFLLGKI